MSGGIIALSVVLGFVALAGAIFCAWFFWLRRKYGQDGVVLGARARKRKGSQPSEGGGAGLDDEDEEVDVVTRARRARKFKSMQRQKSMIDGYSDFDVDTTWSADADDSVTAGGAKAEYDPVKSDVTDGIATLEKEATTRSADGLAARRSRARISAWEGAYPPTGWKATDTRSSGRAVSAVGYDRDGVQTHDRTGSASTMATSTTNRTTIHEEDELPPMASKRFADQPASPSREALLADHYELGITSPERGSKSGDFADGSILRITDPAQGRRL